MVKEVIMYCDYCKDPITRMKTNGYKKPMVQYLSQKFCSKPCQAKGSSRDSTGVPKTKGKYSFYTPQGIEDKFLLGVG